ncbi:MAG: hypothetical protein UY72_C0070G0006, partial [Candidatus Uhrbacteria bacterium GW2011_GWD2_52_7]
MITSSDNSIPPVIGEAIRGLNHAYGVRSVNAFAHYGSALLAAAITIGWLTLSTHVTPFSPRLFALGIVGLISHHVFGVLTSLSAQRMRRGLHANVNVFISALLTPSYYLMQWLWLTFERLSGMNDKIFSDPRVSFLVDVRTLHSEIAFTEHLRQCIPQRPSGTTEATTIVGDYIEEQRDLYRELTQSLSTSFNRYPLGMHPAQTPGRKFPSFTSSEVDSLDDMADRLRAAQ